MISKAACAHSVQPSKVPSILEYLPRLFSLRKRVDLTLAESCRLPDYPTDTERVEYSDRQQSTLRSLRLLLSTSNWSNSGVLTSYFRIEKRRLQCAFHSPVFSTIARGEASRIMTVTQKIGNLLPGITVLNPACLTLPRFAAIAFF